MEIGKNLIMQNYNTDCNFMSNIFYLKIRKKIAFINCQAKSAITIKMYPDKKIPSYDIFGYI